MALSTLQDLLIEELQDTYDAEHQILEALPKMAEAATNKKLATAFRQHLKQTQTHVTRLEKVFGILGEEPKRKKCKAMAGLTAEGAEILKEDADGDVRDAAMIAAAQKVEHYEIAGYGTLRTWAQLLGHEDAVKLLQTTLDEEGATDKKLTALAEGSVNEDAVEDEV
jgi:ferritin-like metal-binding protein YciE